MIVQEEVVRSFSMICDVVVEDHTRRVVERELDNRKFSMIEIVLW